MPSIPKAELWIRGGHEDGRTIDLTDGVTSIGRAPINKVVVEVTGVSRQHARIRAEVNGYWIEDLGSRNGTFVNGTPVEGEGQKLRNMDRIDLGGCEVLHWVFREVAATVGITRPSMG